MYQNRRRYLWLIIVLLLFVMAYSAGAQELKDPSPGVDYGLGQPSQTTGGPDVFGYTFADQVEPTCGQQFVDISVTGTLIDWGFGGPDDNSSGPLPLAVPFNFYGVDYTELVVSTNGYISTDPTDPGTSLGGGFPIPSLCPLPDSLLSGGGARMFPLLDDLVTETAYYEYFPVCPRASDRCRAPEDCTIFQWDNSHHFGNPEERFDFKAILYHQTYEIVFQIDTGNPEMGTASTTGIQAEPTTPLPPTYPTGIPTSGLTYACDTADTIPDNTSVCFFHPVPVPDPCVFSDLVITKLSDAGPRVPLGDTVTYTVAVVNDGPDDARGTQVTDVLDPGIAWISDDCGAGPPAGDVLTWDVPSLPNGSLAACNIVVEVVGTPGDFVDNTATVDLDNFDPDTSSNTSATITFQIGPVGDLGIDKQVMMVNVPAREVVYALTASNGGPDLVPAVTVTDEFPAELMWISDDCGAGPPSGPGELTWDVGTLAPGAMTTCQAVFKISPFTSGTVVNSATVTAPVVFDATVDNDEDSAEFMIDMSPDAIFADGFASGDASAWGNVNDGG